MRSIVGDTSHKEWLWWAIDHHTGEFLVFHFGTREDKKPGQTVIFTPSVCYKHGIYSDHKYAYRSPVTEREVVTGKENTQKIERKHLSLRTWCSRLVRKGIHLSKDPHMHKIVIAVVITFWFFQIIIWQTTSFAHYSFIPFTRSRRIVHD
jgi:insertion element IS1 protein InsB